MNRCPDRLAVLAVVGGSGTLASDVLAGIEVKRTT